MRAVATSFIALTLLAHNRRRFSGNVSARFVRNFSMKAADYVDNNGMSPFRAVGAASVFSRRIKFNCAKISFVPVTGRSRLNLPVACARAAATCFGTGCMTISCGSASTPPTRFAG
jgi:hypothetical protein